MKHIASLTIFVMLLSSCTSLPAFISTSTPTPTPTLTTTPTVVPSTTPSPTPTISPAVTMLDVYLAGEQVDTSSLSPEEFADFSKALAETRNDERGVQLVIYDSGNDNPAYIDQNLDMRPYDGKPDQSKTIQMFIPVAGFDNQGNLQIEENGKVIIIANSNDIDWNAVITSSSDTRINWPTGKWGENMRWLTENGSNPLVLKPVVFLNKDTHSFFLENYGMQNGFEVLTVEETDKNGTPILLRKSLIIPGSQLELMEEGSDERYTSLDSRPETDSLEEYCAYYLIFYSNQNAVYEKYYSSGAAVDNYQGIVSTDKIVATLKNEIDNKQDFLVIPTKILMKNN